MSKKPAVQSMTPLVTSGAVWASRKGMRTAYEKKTGNQPPRAGDLDQPMSRVLLWTVGTAVVIALIEVAIQQGLSRYLQKREAAANSAPAEA